jgi:hypothetical protein
VLNKFYKFSKIAIFGNLLNLKGTEGTDEDYSNHLSYMDLDSVEALEIYLEFTMTFEKFNLQFLSFYPKYHSDMRLFLRESLKRLGVNIICLLLEQLCKKSIQKTKINDCPLIDLMITEIILNLVYQPNPNLAEQEESVFTQLKMKVSSCFCSHFEYSSSFPDFYAKNKNNLLSCYYFLKIMGYFINMDKDGEYELESNIKMIVHAVDHGYVELEDLFNSHLLEFDGMCK